MNNFYLVLIRKNGTIFHDFYATSHNDLIHKFTTHYDNISRDYIKATFSPGLNHRLDDLASYSIIFNQQYIPDWFNQQFKCQVYDDLINIISKMIISNDVDVILNEGIILTGNAKINDLKHSIVYAMYDNSYIKCLDYNTEVLYMGDNSIIDEMCDNTKVIRADSFSKINNMYDYSKVIDLTGHASVGDMYQNSRISTIKFDANIDEMHNDSSAYIIKHMGKVNEMHGFSVIEEIHDNTIVNKMFDNSRINYMHGESKIIEMHDDSMIESMYGNSIVELSYANSLVRKINEKAKILKKLL